MTVFLDLPGEMRLVLIFSLGRWFSCCPLLSFRQDYSCSAEEDALAGGRSLVTASVFGTSAGACAR